MSTASLVIGLACLGVGLADGSGSTDGAKGSDETGAATTALCRGGVRPSSAVFTLRDGMPARSVERWSNSLASACNPCRSDETWSKSRSRSAMLDLKYG
ncbi:hypothetical protein, partial [Brevundimonas bullata]|uniref:hypothetical protein n=1 Tax=Brevundimonas bullata TaxID=13160 RepID=UPI002FDA3C1C